MFFFQQREVRLPEFEGDDMVSLVKEIELARTFLVQARGYRYKIYNRCYSTVV